jgi:hypothetical protein
MQTKYLPLLSTCKDSCTVDNTAPLDLGRELHTAGSIEPAQVDTFAGTFEVHIADFGKPELVDVGKAVDLIDKEHNVDLAVDIHGLHMEPAVDTG